MFELAEHFMSSTLGDKNFSARVVGEPFPEESIIPAFVSKSTLSIECDVCHPEVV